MIEVGYMSADVVVRKTPKIFYLFTLFDGDED